MDEGWIEDGAKCEVSGVRGQVERETVEGASKECRRMSGRRVGEILSDSQMRVNFLPGLLGFLIKNLGDSSKEMSRF